VYLWHGIAEIAGARAVNNKPEILIVDDDASFLSYVSQFLRPRGYIVQTLDSAGQLLDKLAGGMCPSVILLDIMFPGSNGLEILAQLRNAYPSIPVIMLSAVGHTKSVVEAIRMGAFDYLTKPFEEQELELAIEDVLQKKSLQDEVKNLRRQLERYGESGDFVSTSPKIAQIKEIARQVAGTDVPVLILGESGVGKEVLARFIHTHAGRDGKPFVKVNCAALPHDLLESELFGYERGAFTGAMGEKPGKFELADKGTILLDEIGEMSPHLQAKLLHVLQDGEYTRLGGRRAARVDARVLASTNRKLSEAVAKGQFREDLYYRLNVVTIEIPPLRERPQDIPLLCHYFVQKYADRYESSVHELPPQLLDVATRYQWPGNIRELENVIRRFLILPDLEATLRMLQPHDIPEPAAADQKPALKKLSNQAAEQVERELVLRTLSQTNWNRKRAAQELGICYKALLNKLKKWNINGRALSASSSSFN
jgi:two-component system, NtrC family, response regulator AtoC